MKLIKIVQNNFTLIPHGPKKKLDLYKCNHCVKEYAYHVTRLSNHLTECRGCPTKIKELIESCASKKKIKKRCLIW